MRTNAPAARVKLPQGVFFLVDLPESESLSRYKDHWIGKEYKAIDIQPNGRFYRGTLYDLQNVNGSKRAPYDSLYFDYMEGKFTPEEEEVGLD